MQTVETACFHETFERGAIHRAKIDALTEVKQRRKCASLRARIDDRAHRTSAHALDCLESKANVTGPR